MILYAIKLKGEKTFDWRGISPHPWMVPGNFYQGSNDPTQAMKDDGAKVVKIKVTEMKGNVKE